MRTRKYTQKIVFRASATNKQLFLFPASLNQYFLSVGEQLGYLVIAEILDSAGHSCAFFLATAQFRSNLVCSQQLRVHLVSEGIYSEIISINHLTTITMQRNEQAEEGKEGNDIKKKNLPSHHPSTNYRALTVGSLSPPTSNLTAPSFSASVRMVLLSLSATYRQLQGSSGARAKPEGCANPALWGQELFRFSSLPLPAQRRHVPALDSLFKFQEIKTL